MIPETSQAKTIELYRCFSFPEQWQLETVLMKDVEAVDTTLAEIGGLWWMFTSIAVEGIREVFELHIFYADTPHGPWKPHDANPVKADVRARPAGRLIQHNKEWYRPSQTAFGESVLIYKIERLTPHEFVETEVSAILPQWTDNLVGTHTFNTIDGLTVIDGLRRRRR